MIRDRVIWAGLLSYYGLWAKKLYLENYYKVANNFMKNSSIFSLSLSLSLLG
jgi:hypothetical protein